MLIRLHLIDVIEPQAEQTGGGGILSERARHSRGRLNSLVLHLEPTNADRVLVDVASRGATVSVANAPGGTLNLDGRGAGVDIINLVAILLGNGGLAAEDPQIR